MAFMRKLRNTGKDISRGLAAAGQVAVNALDLAHLDEIVDQLAREVDNEINALAVPVRDEKLQEFFEQMCSSAYASYDEQVGLSDEHKSNISVRRRILGRQLNAKLPALQARNQSLAFEQRQVINTARDRFADAVSLLRREMPLPAESLRIRLERAEIDVRQWVELSYPGGVHALRRSSDLEPPLAAARTLSLEMKSTSVDSPVVSATPITSSQVYNFGWDELFARISETKLGCIAENDKLIAEAVAELSARSAEVTMAKVAAFVRTLAAERRADVDAMDISLLSEADAEKFRSDLKQQTLSYMQRVEATSFTQNSNRTRNRNNHNKNHK